MGQTTSTVVLAARGIAFTALYLVAQTTPLDAIARITRAWNDLTPTDGRSVFWTLYLADYRARLSSSVLTGHSIQVLISAQEERQLGERVVVLIDIHDCTDVSEPANIRAYTVARYQNRNTVLQESGIHVQCATTHICRAWRNGAPVKLPFTAWEHADYIMVQMQERTAYGPIVDLFNSPQENDPDTISERTEEAPPVDEANPVATEEALSADEAAQAGTEEAQSTDEALQDGVDTTLSDEGSLDDANPDQDFLVVIRRPRLRHPTDQFLVYVGDKEAEEASAQARLRWRLGPSEPDIKEVHNSFYTSFPEDVAWTMYLTLEKNILRTVPHLRSTLMHLRKYGQRDYQAVFLARHTSELGILSFCHLLHTCKTTENNKCVVTHNNRRVHGASPILVDHGDYIRVELMSKDNLMQTATLISTIEEDYTQNDRNAFWPARRLSLDPPQQRSISRSRSASRTREGKQSLHEVYWFLATIFIWMFVPLLIHIHEQEHPTTKARRRHRGEGGLRRRQQRAMLFCCLLLLQHCQALSAPQVQSYAEPAVRRDHGQQLHCIGSDIWSTSIIRQIDHFQGLRPGESSRE